MISSQSLRAITLGLLASAAAVSPAAAQASRLSASTLDSIALANISRDNTVGAVVGIVHRGEPLHVAAYGKADVEADVALRSDAILAIGSISKQFTAAAVLQLRDQGKLSLDDAISTWLPEVSTGGSRVTLRHLLSHTSGMADVTTIPGLNTYRFVTPTYNAQATRDSMYAAIARHPLTAPPGAAFLYSSAGYWLLHRVVERASGLLHHQYLEEHILRPLGMLDTGACHGEPGSPRRAAGYGVRAGARRRAPESASEFYLGSGELCSTVADMLSWLQALHGGRVLSAASYAEMTTPATLLDGWQLPYGLGLDLRQDARGNEYVGHSGEIAGYAARANGYPDAQLAVVVMMNSSFDSSPTALVDALVAGILPRTSPAPSR